MPDKMEMDKTGRLIARQRGALGLTQKELGRRVGVSDKAVSKWERGLSFPDITLLPALAEALGVSVGELLSGEEQPPEAPIAPHKLDEVVDKAMEYTKESQRAKGKRVALTLWCAAAALTALTCLIVNLAVSRRVDWALLPIGGVLLVLAVLAAALYGGRFRIEALALTTAIGVSGYLFLVQWVLERGGWAPGAGNWALSIGLPITLLCCVLGYITAKVAARFADAPQFRAAAILVGVALLMPCIQALLHRAGVQGDDLSSIIGTPVCLAAAVVLVAIGKTRGNRQ